MTALKKDLGIEGALHEMETTHTEGEIKFHRVSPDVLKKTNNPLYAGRYVAIEPVATADEAGTHNTQEIYVSEEIKDETAQAIMAKLAKILLETSVEGNTEAYKMAIEQSILKQGDPSLIHGTIESMLEEIIYQIELEDKNTKPHETVSTPSPKLIALKKALSFLQTK